ncbi:tetratricopeptide repeat protein [Chryseobacterium sp. A301]
MKNVLLITGILFSLNFVSAQQGEQINMHEKIEQLEQRPSFEHLKKLSNEFATLASQDPSNWLPNYFAALAQIRMGRSLMMEGKIGELDPYADKAESYVAKAMALQPENAELYILKKMIHGLRLMVNPMERYASESMLGAQSLEKAEKIDPTNPRITLLRAEDLYYTPEEYGGSKSKGLELFAKSIEQFDSYQVKGKNAPNWGKSEAEYFLKSKP